MHEAKNGYQRAVERGQQAKQWVEKQSTSEPNALQRFMSSPECTWKGPYSKLSGGKMQDGYWHKENHQGPQDCVGCCVDG